MTAGQPHRAALRSQAAGGCRAQSTGRHADGAAIEPSATRAQEKGKKGGETEERKELERQVNHGAHSDSLLMSALG